MRIQEIYDEPPMSIGTTLGHLHGLDWVLPQANILWLADSEEDPDEIEVPGLEVRVHRSCHSGEDHYRGVFYNLTSLWYETQPILIIESWGYDEDERSYYITDPEGYKRLVKAILVAQPICSPAIWSERLHKPSWDLGETYRELNAEQNGVVGL